MMRGRFAPALGQAAAPTTMQLSLCSLVEFVMYVPGVKEIVQQIGCKNPAAKAALSAAIIQNFTKQTGGKLEATPQWAQVLAIAGPEILADCVCQDKRFQPPPGGWPKAPSQDLSLSSPIVIGGLALAAVAVALVLAKRQAPMIVAAAPQPVAAAPAVVQPAATPIVAPSPSAKPSAATHSTAKLGGSRSPRASQRRYRRTRY